MLTRTRVLEYYSQPWCAELNKKTRLLWNFWHNRTRRSNNRVTVQKSSATPDLLLIKSVRSRWQSLSALLPTSQNLKI